MSTEAPTTVKAEIQQTAYTRYFNELHELLLAACATDKDGKKLSIEAGTEKALEMLSAVKPGGRKVMLVGNGGSAAIASHQSIDFLNAAGIPAITFSDAAQLTCLGNDYGYENIYSRAIDMLGQAGDVLIAISSSGKSQNILKAARAAKEKGCLVITVAGFSAQAPLLALGDLNFYIDSEKYGFVEIAHLALIHYLTDTLAAKRRGVTL